MKEQKQDVTDLSEAVIYVRVSSSKQKQKGDGLASQRTRCEEFARYKGLDVIEVFEDDASGGLIDRPGIQAMLKFIRSRRKQKTAVIIWPEQGCSNPRHSLSVQGFS